MATLDPSLIYQRTAQGELLARTPRQISSYAARATLLLVDGQIPVGELVRRFGETLPVEDTLRGLEEDGLVEKVLSSVVTEPAAAFLDAPDAPGLAPEAALDPLWDGAAPELEPEVEFRIAPEIETEALADQSDIWPGRSPLPASDAEPEDDGARRLGRAWRKGVVGGVALVVLMLALGGGQAWLAGLKPKMEARASQMLGVTVEVGSVGPGWSRGPVLQAREMVIRAPHVLRLEEVFITPHVGQGHAQSPSSFSVSLAGGRLRPSELAALLGLFAGAGDLAGVEITHLGLLLGGSVMEGLSGTMARDDQGRGELVLRDATGRYALTAHQGAGGLLVRISASPGALPLLGGVEVGPMELAGFLGDDGFKGGEWTLTALGGRLEGSLVLGWSNPVVLTGALRMTSLDAGQVLRVRHPKARAEGAVVGTLRMSAQAESWDALAAHLTLEGPIQMERGAFKGMDLGLAVRERGAGLISGGETRFEALRGRVRIDPQGGSLVVERLEAGALSASGRLATNASEELSGSWLATVRVPGRAALSYPMSVTGSVAAPQLRMGGSAGG